MTSISNTSGISNLIKNDIGTHSTEKGLIATIAEVFDKVIWGFVNQIGKFIRITFKIAINESPEYAERLDKVITQVGLLTGISILISLIFLPSQLKDLYKNALLDDLEGGVLGTFELMATLGDILDNVTTFINSLSAIDALPKIAFFGVIGLPLAIGLISYAIASKVYSLVCNGHFIYSLPNDVTSSNLEEFKQFITEKTTHLDYTLKERKIRILSRHSDPRVVKIMQNLCEYLKKNPQDFSTANAALQDMKSIIKRKMTLNLVTTVANIAMLISVIAGAIFPAAGMAVPIVGAVKVCSNMVTHAYNTFFFESGLNKPEFFKT